MRKQTNLGCPAVLLLVGLLFLGAQPRSVFAQETNDVAGKKPDVPAAPVHQLDRGDNAWMLTSSALVLFMTTPGLAMFYGGLVRKKNVVSVLMQCVFLMGLMTVLWATVGYSLAFGGTEAWIGNGDYLFMNGVQATWGTGRLRNSAAPHAEHSHADAHALPGHVLHHHSGADLRRLRRADEVQHDGRLHDPLGLLVYCPLCHWVWGGGALAYGTEHARPGAPEGRLDFAGGTVVHISSGVSALVCALVLGKRTGFPTEPMPPHNLTYTALGAGMLWVGWFGFNAGSALAADAIASSAFAATHFSAAAGAVAWPSRSGCAASRRCSEPVPAPWPAWSALRRLPVL